MMQPDTQDPADDSHEGQSLEVKPRRRRFQFGISGLMVTVFGVAIGLSLLHIEEVRYSDCILAAVSAWFALGLLMQSWDLVFTLWRNSMLPADRKCACCFAIIWRLVIVVSLVCHYVLFQLISNGLLIFEDDKWSLLSEKKLLEILFLLSLLVVLWSLNAAKQRKHGWYSRTITVLGSIVCTVWIFYCCVDAACVPFLVYIATFGIEMSSPLRYSYSVFGPQQTQEHYYLLIGSLAAAGLLGASIAACILMVRRWQQSGRTRIILAISSFGFLALASVLPLWIYSFELKRLSVAFAGGLWGYSRVWWIVGGLLCLASASGIAWRVTRRASITDDESVDTVRPNGRVYYHEQASVIFCLLVAMSFVLAKILQRYGIFAPNYCFAVPYYCVPLAVFLMAARVFWQRLRRPVDLPSPMNFAVSPGCYALTWLNMLGIVVVGASTLAWLGFSVWIVPYWTSYW